jgi:hypothetical protein
VNWWLAHASNASFIAFDEAFFDIMGPYAICEKLFEVSEGVHEAPVWLSGVNKLLVSPLNQSFQLLIDLNTDPVRTSLSLLITAYNEFRHPESTHLFCKWSMGC